MPGGNVWHDDVEIIWKDQYRFTGNINFFGQSCYCFYVILHHVVSVFIMTKMKGYGVIIIDVWFKIALFLHPFFLDWEEKCSRKLTLRSKVFNPLTAEWALRALRDFTLSNARWFYSSMGNPLDGKGLMCRANIWPVLDHKTFNTGFLLSFLERRLGKTKVVFLDDVIK